MNNNSAFYQAIMSGRNNWLNFSSRAGRFEYWAWAIFMGLLDAIINILLLNDIDTQYIIDNFKFPPLSFANNIFFLLSILLYIFSFISSLSLGFRRLHDINKSAWWNLLVFIPILGWIILFYWMGIKKGDDSSNRFGEPSNIIASGIDILLLIGILILSISVNVVSKDPLTNPKQIEQHLSVDN
ncbi:MAG: DUF805 domain-containing protein [Rickettsia endosymbiont of Bryobia graminum]|nr:DUF805 domain-containing protein [Rickettsia endosymbiont of Bryobia graminum]